MNKKVYLFFAIVVLFMLVSIEVELRKDYAPENVLIKVLTPSGKPDLNATCNANIYFNNEIIKDKKLNYLDSLYDFVDVSNSFSKDSKGFYLLKTGFKNYKGDYEIKIQCFSSEDNGYGFIVLNRKNIPCELKENGKFLVC